MNKIYCHWDIIRFLEEDQVSDNCIALEDVKSEIHYDLMVYLYKEGDKYLVDVYKSEDENDFDRFSFDDFIEARNFVYYLPYEHPEYKERPFVKIDCNKCMEGAPYRFCCKDECGEHVFCRGCTFRDKMT